MKRIQIILFFLSCIITQTWINHYLGEFEGRTPFYIVTETCTSTALLLSSFALASSAWYRSQRLWPRLGWLLLYCTAIGAFRMGTYFLHDCVDELLRSGM